MLETFKNTCKAATWNSAPNSHKYYTFSLEPIADVKIRIDILQSTLTKDFTIPFSRYVVAGGKIEADVHAGLHASRLPKEREVTSSVVMVLLSDVTSMDAIPSFQLWCSVLTFKDFELWRY